MKQAKWQKFLKETIPSFRSRRRLQQHLGHHLIMQTPLGQNAAKSTQGSRA